MSSCVELFLCASRGELLCLDKTLILRGVCIVGTYSLEYEAAVTFKVLKAVKLYTMVLWFMTSDVLIHEYCNRTHLKSIVRRNVINVSTTYRRHRPMLLSSLYKV